jgi:hypothetical protein
MLEKEQAYFETHKDDHCKLSFSGDSHRGVFSYEALQYLDEHFKTPAL